jgi:hypothetical protein
MSQMERKHWYSRGHSHLRHTGPHMNILRTDTVLSLLPHTLNNVNQKEYTF